jgi:putative DNA methylase
MAVVAEGTRERVYLPPTKELEKIAIDALPDSRPETDLPSKALGFRIQEYGMKKWGDMFTQRQLVALNTLSDLTLEIRNEIINDSINCGYKEGKSLEQGGHEAVAYADTVATYLAFAIDRCADFSNTCSRWGAGNQKVMSLFGKQAIAMTWDFTEAAVLQDTVGGFLPAAEFIASCIKKLPQIGYGKVMQLDAMTSTLSQDKVISCDPPYYDNIGYADLSDFFYVWLRRSLKSVFPELFSTMAVPKVDELIASPFRHNTKDAAEKFFLEGMSEAMKRLADNAHPAFPVTIYYAFKQSESDDSSGTTNTGWDTFLAAVIKAGFSITGTWPMRSEQEFRMVSRGTNALSSSIVLVCRRRKDDAPITTRREFLSILKNELPIALKHLQEGNIAPVDLAQAAIGPGMAVFTRFSKILDAEGVEMSVRTALSLINQILDETLTLQEGDFDAESRWALTWFEQNGFVEGDFGVADQLSKSKNISIDGLVEGKILLSKGGKVRLLLPIELDEKWNPLTDNRLTAWEVVHQLIRALESTGEEAAAKLVSNLGIHAETARELCYRLYTLCERKKRANEAMSYNGLVQSWPEIVRLSREISPASKSGTQDLFGRE